MNRTLETCLMIIALVAGEWLLLKLNAFLTNGDGRIILISIALTITLIIFTILTHFGMKEKKAIIIAPTTLLLLVISLYIYVILSEPPIYNSGELHDKKSTDDATACYLQAMEYCNINPNATLCNITDCPKCTYEISCEGENIIKP